MKSLKKIAATLLLTVFAFGMSGCKVEGETESTPEKKTVATPVFSIEADAVYSGTELSISCATKDAKIFYTTDESEPTSASTEYTTAINITEKVTIKAIAVKSGMNNSKVAVAAYKIKINYGTCVAGDFILKDGNILSKDATLTDDLKSNIAAIIVREKSDEAPALGIGIVRKTGDLVWCTADAAAFEYISELEGTETTGLSTGRDSWSKIKEVTNETDEDISKYPAFEFSFNYATTNGLGEEISTGWYLPAMAELAAISTNKNIVNQSFRKATGNNFSSFEWYWSCNQTPKTKYFAQLKSFSDDNMYGYNKKMDGGSYCSFRIFE